MQLLRHQLEVFLFCSYCLFKISEAYISETCTVIAPKQRRSFQQSVEIYYSQLKCSGTYPTSSKTTNIQVLKCII